MATDPLPEDPSTLKDGIDDLLEHDRAETDESLERERRITDEAIGRAIEEHVGDTIEEHRSQVDDRLEAVRERGDEQLAGAAAVLPEVAETLQHAAESLADVAEDLTQAAASLQRPSPVAPPPLEAADTVSEVAETLIDVAQRVADERQLVDESLQEERALLDEVLEQERALSDTTRRFERDARQVLLEAERQRTDRHLDEERRDTDSAVQHALNLLVDEQATRVDAEQRALTRDEFLAIVSHDLRSPLDAIAINATLLAENTRPGEEGEKQLRWARNIQRAVDVMSRLVSDLLDIARFEDGEFRISREERDLMSVIKEAVDTFMPMAAARNLTLDVRCPPPPLSAWFDHDRVLQVLSNLLRNAMQFTSPGGSILIEVTAESDATRVAVRDTGSGIPAAHQARIFDRFQQLQSADRKGLGLGLYISKRIVDAHGGRIWVESVPGQGSTFYFTLPGR